MSARMEILYGIYTANTDQESDTKVKVPSYTKI